MQISKLLAALLPQARYPRIPVLPVQIEDIQTLLKRSGDNTLSR